MNRKIVLSLTVMIFITMFSGMTLCLADANVGVIVGVSNEYTSADSGIKRDSSGDLIDSLPFTVSYLETITVQQISGTNVTIEFERDFLNGTTSSGTSWVDLNTGEGTALFVIVPSGLEAGSLIYPDWTNENGTTDGAPTVTDIVYLKNYNDITVEAAHFSLTYTVDDQDIYSDYYWDKSTGLLLRYTINGSTVTDGVTTDSTIHFNGIGINQVFYPLIDSEDYPVSVATESSVLSFEFKQESKQLLLTVSGQTGTLGSCQIAVPDSLLSGTFTLNMDGYALVEGDDYTQTSNGTHQIFDLNYVHSTHTIEIIGTQTIPEFSTTVIVSVFLISSLIAVVVYKKHLAGATA